MQTEAARAGRVGSRLPHDYRSFLVGGLIAVMLGVLVSFPAPALLVAGFIAAAAAAAAMLRWPALAPASFWLVYSVQSTVFPSTVVTGLYYPLYAIMGANVIIGIALGRLRLAPGLLVAYGAFLIMVVWSLLITPASLGFAAYQRLFIYVLGVLVLAQYGDRRQLGFLPAAQVVSTLVLSGWAIYTAFTTGFIHRAGVTTDQNIVSFILGFGILVLVARLLTPGNGLLGRVVTWLALGVGTYAMLLLASRGVAVALLVTLVALYGRIVFDVRRSVPIALMAVVVGLALVALPGSDGLLQRFDESNLSTANERLPLWSAAIASFMDAGPVRATLGQGFESSKDIIRAARPMTTATHNAYLQVLVEFGLVGLAAFLSLHVLLLMRFWRSSGRVALRALGATVFLLMCNLTLDAHDGFPYWVVLGHLIAMVAMGDDREPGYSPADEAAPWRAAASRS